MRERPYLYVGAGVLFSEATEELVALAELLTLPCATTLNGKSAFPEDHPLSLGIGGFGRARYNTLPARADRGECRRHPRGRLRLQIARPRGRSPSRWRQHDPGRHRAVGDQPRPDRRHRADGRRQGRARADGWNARRITAARRRGSSRSTPASPRSNELNQRWDEVCAPLLESGGGADQSVPGHQASCARWSIRPNTIVLHDAGTVRGTISHHYVAPRPRSFLGFGVQSSMGWSLGAAVGAKKAHPDKLVIAIIGEEALNETAIDIETSVRNDAPVLVIVKNNRKIPDQDGGKSKKLAVARFRQGVDVCGLATALGAKVYRIEKPGDLAGHAGEGNCRCAWRPHRGGRGADGPHQRRPAPPLGPERQEAQRRGACGVRATGTLPRRNAMISGFVAISRATAAWVSSPDVASVSSRAFSTSVR